MEIEQVVVQKVENITYKNLHVLDILIKRDIRIFLNYILVDKNL